ncbi:polysaccharide deacetylase family protein [bacterium 210820-DFI.6.52]|nr:polysaccharide deacetylase family protein [bacterium 210820-DFI.6.52]
MIPLATTQSVLAAGAACAAAYFVAPSLSCKAFSRSVWRQTGRPGKLLLTFDDGPDPRYTPALLDLLGEWGIPACFFVVGENAAACPDLIRRMTAEGHEVGIHSYRHENARFRRPSFAGADLEQSLATLRELGTEPRYYRPPWGNCNPFTLYEARARGLETVLWSVMAQDWERGATPRRTAQRLLGRVGSSSIICLHDRSMGKSADDTAPGRTIQALRLALPALQRAGFTFILPEEMAR